MKKTILFCMLLLSIKATTAQTIKGNIKGSFGPSSIKNNVTPTSSGFTYGLGAEAYMHILQKYKLAINPSIDYVATGYNGKGASTTDKVKVNYVVISMPIVFTNMENLFDYGKNAFVAGVGPYIGFATSGKFNTYSNSSYKKMNFGNTVSDNRKSIDAGLVLKSGFSHNKVYFGLQYTIGMLNVIPKDRIKNGEFIKTRNFMFQFAYNIF